MTRLFSRWLKPWRTVAPMPDWSQITDAEWQAQSDTELARRLGCTASAVSAARARLGKPPSPAGHGGVREGAGRKLAGDDEEMTTAVINLTKGAKRRLMEAHKAAGTTWNAWALRSLEDAARREAGEG